MQISYFQMKPLFRSVVIALSAMALSQIAFAQDEEAEDNSEEASNIIEEVMVSGMRSSLRDAIDIKRSNVGTMEAISTEDFGKYPDGGGAGWR